MARTKQSQKPLADQMKSHIQSEEEDFTLKGNFKTMTSTGSTLVDLAISGGRIRGGGLPSKIMLICYGPSQSGKTAFLSEIAGNILKADGDVQFNDPEARLDQEFASIFGMHINPKNYHQPNTVTTVFKNLREFKPKNPDVINGIFTDSLAALSTEMEMESEDGDKMGGRRAKEFSEGLRKHARVIHDKNYIFACSNQIREKMDAGKYESKYVFPGGKALWFYASIVLRFSTAEKIFKEVKFHGKEIKQAVGIETEIIVEKTVDTPFRRAPLIITYGYGIDDIRANLQYVKSNKKHTTYKVGDVNVGQSLDEAVLNVEQGNLVKRLRRETIDLWEEIQELFKTERKPK
jgi:RecA/RadA recombinase